VLPDADSSLSPGSVVVENGHIAYVGPQGSAPSSDARVDLGEAVLCPGLVNAHSHLDLSHLRGKAPYRGCFGEWIDRVRELRAAPGMREAALEGLKGALARGTTCFGDVVSPSAFAAMVSVFEEGGARGRLYVEALGFRPEAAERGFEAVRQLVETRGLPPGVATGVSPHAPYSVSRPLLDRLLAMAEASGLPVAIHVAETLEELAFLRHGIGPIREALRRFGADDPAYEPYESVRGFLDCVRVARAPLALVHGNYMRPRDVPARATVVYCPTAHAFFRHPQHPVAELLEEGVRVALGSDSAASDGALDVLSETQRLARDRGDLDARAVFRMATEWGARALDLPCGRLAEGTAGDLAAYTPVAGHEILGRADARCVLAAVGGRIVHRAG
jgi:cytosine/adenosine deaminase-related metal-dependent hydrolase